MTKLEKEVLEALESGKKINNGYYFETEHEVYLTFEKAPNFFSDLKYYDFVFKNVLYSMKICDVWEQKNSIAYKIQFVKLPIFYSKYIFFYDSSWFIDKNNRVHHNHDNLQFCDLL